MTPFSTHNRNQKIFNQLDWQFPVAVAVHIGPPTDKTRGTPVRSLTLLSEEGQSVLAEFTSGTQYIYFAPYPIWANWILRSAVHDSGEWFDENIRYNAEICYAKPDQTQRTQIYAYYYHAV